MSDPVDSASGFQVLKRKQPEPTKELAMRTLELPYAGLVNAAAAAGSYEESAREMAHLLGEHPEAFASWHEHLCCRGVQRWRAGHGDPALTSLLEGMSFGQVSSVPIPMNGHFMVVQRVDPDLLPAEPEPEFDLPRPDPPNLAVIFAQAPKLELERDVKEAKAALVAPMLTDAERSVVRKAFDELLSRLSAAASPHDAVEAFNGAQAVLHDELSEASYAATMTGIEQWVIFKLLQSPP